MALFREKACAEWRVYSPRPESQPPGFSSSIRTASGKSSLCPYAAETRIQSGAPSELRLELGLCPAPLPAPRPHWAPKALSSLPLPLPEEDAAEEEEEGEALDSVGLELDARVGTGPRWGRLSRGEGWGGVTGTPDGFGFSSFNSLFPLSLPSRIWVWPLSPIPLLPKSSLLRCPLPSP